MTLIEYIKLRIEKIKAGEKPITDGTFLARVDRQIQLTLDSKYTVTPSNTGTLLQYVAYLTYCSRVNKQAAIATVPDSGTLTVVQLKPEVGRTANGAMLYFKIIGKTHVGAFLKYTKVADEYVAQGNDQYTMAGHDNDEFKNDRDVNFMTFPHAGEIKRVNRVSYLTGEPEALQFWRPIGGGWNETYEPQPDRTDLYHLVDDGDTSKAIVATKPAWTEKTSYGHNYGNIDWKGPEGPDGAQRVILTWKGPPTRSFKTDPFISLDGLTRQCGTATVQMEELPIYTTFWNYVYCRGVKAEQSPASATAFTGDTWVLGAAVTGNNKLIIVTGHNVNPNSYQFEVYTKPFNSACDPALYHETDKPYGWKLVCSHTSPGRPLTPWHFSADALRAINVGPTIHELVITVQSDGEISGEITATANTGITRTFNATYASVSDPGTKPSEFTPPIMTENGGCITRDKDDPLMVAWDGAYETIDTLKTQSLIETGEIVIADDPAGYRIVLEVATTETDSSDMHSVLPYSFARTFHDAPTDTGFSLSSGELQIGTEFVAEGGHTGCESEYEWSISPCGELAQSESAPNRATFVSLNGCCNVNQLRVSVTKKTKQYSGEKIDTATRIISLDDYNQSNSPVPVPSIVGNPSTLGVNGYVTATGGKPPYTFSTNRGIIHPYTGYFTIPERCGTVTFTVTDSCGASGQVKGRLPEGYWKQRPEENTHQICPPFSPCSMTSEYSLAYYRFTWYGCGSGTGSNASIDGCDTINPVYGWQEVQTVINGPVREDRVFCTQIINWKYLPGQPGDYTGDPSRYAEAIAAAEAGTWQREGGNAPTDPLIHQILHTWYEFTYPYLTYGYTQLNKVITGLSIARTYDWECHL